MSIALERVTCFHAPPALDDVEPCNSLIGRCVGGSDGGDDEEEEVQSSFKGPLDTMGFLEDALPNRVEEVHNSLKGPLDSMDSLGDALPISKAMSLTVPSLPEDSSSRKRKIALSFNFWEKLSHTHVALSKRPTNSNRATHALAALQVTAAAHHAITTTE